MNHLFNSLESIKEAVREGKTVYWCNFLYIVKIDFEGDFVIKCTDTAMQELLSYNHRPIDFFTN